LGAIAAIAAGSAIAARQQRRRRRWREYDTEEIRDHLQERFAALDQPTE